jgi:hypothetical protein
MAQVRFTLANEEYYHVFNRGVARQPKYDFKYALSALSYYRFDTPILIPPTRCQKLTKTIFMEHGLVFNV